MPIAEWLLAARPVDRTAHIALIDLGQPVQAAVDLIVPVRIIGLIFNLLRLVEAVELIQIADLVCFVEPVDLAALFRNRSGWQRGAEGEHDADL